jgi:hypothetical protein
LEGRPRWHPRHGRRAPLQAPSRLPLSVPLLTFHSPWLGVGADPRPALRRGGAQARARPAAVPLQRAAHSTGEPRLSRALAPCPNPSLHISSSPLSPPPGAPSPPRFVACGESSLDSSCGELLPPPLGRFLPLTDLLPCCAGAPASPSRRRRLPSPRASSAVMVSFVSPWNTSCARLPPCSNLAGPRRCSPRRRRHVARRARDRAVGASSPWVKAAR